MNIKERLEKSYTLKEPDFGLDNGVHFTWQCAAYASLLAPKQVKNKLFLIILFFERAVVEPGRDCSLPVVQTHLSREHL
jgi:hypothetical protein